MLDQIVWKDNPRYTRLRHYAALTTRSCFRSFTVEGRENLPKDGAVMLGPNHCAAFMDPMTVLAGTDRAVGFGARSDVFANPKTRSLLYWMRILPIARERNGLQEVTKNYEIFDEIVECMGHGLAFCLFSEGRHRAERGMLPVKKGIFRVAKQAVDTLDMPVYVVPMGLDYEHFFRTQCRAAVRIGEPIDVGAFFAARPGMPEGDVYRELCAELQERDLALIGRIPERRHDRILLRILVSILLLPLFAVCAAGGILIWLPHLIIMSRIKDKAWYHSVRFLLHLIFPLFWPFDIGFGRILGYWQDLFEDVKGKKAE